MSSNKKISLYTLAFSFVAVAAALAWAKSDNIDVQEPSISRHEAIPLCQPNMSPINVYVENADGVQTHFKFPKEYFNALKIDDDVFSGGRKGRLSLMIDRHSSEPLCRSERMSKYGSEKIGLMLHPRCFQDYEGLNRKLAETLYRKKIGKDELGFEVYEQINPSLPKTTSRLLIPPFDYFKRIVRVTEKTTQPLREAGQKAYAFSFYYNNSTYVEANVHLSSVEELQQIESQVIDFLNKHHTKTTERTKEVCQL